MRALVYEGAYDIRVEERPVPDVPDGYALIRITHTGICGSDLITYSGTHPRAKAPLIIGHEFSGYIAEDAEGFKKGTRVTAYPNFSCGTCLPCKMGNSYVCSHLKVSGIDRDGGMADYIAMPLELIIPLPDKVSNKLGAFIEPMAVTVHAVREIGYVPGDSALVFGGGTIGLTTALTLRNFGCRNVVISEPNATRANIARELGFETLDPCACDIVAEVMRMTDDAGFDWVFDCAGVQSVADVLFYTGKIKGTIAIISSYKKQPVFPMATGISRELVIKFCRVYRMKDFKLAVEIAAADPSYERVITNVIPLEAAGKGFEMMTDFDSGVLKVMYTTLDDNEQGFIQ